jgi:serine/threonine protein kinase
MSSHDGGEKPRRGRVEPVALEQTLATPSSGTLTVTNEGFGATVVAANSPSVLGPMRVTNVGLDATMAGLNPRHGSRDVLPDPELKSTFEGYELLERVGEGGMGVVYKAYDQTLDRKVALKLVRSRAADDAERAAQSARVLREAQAMAKLSHPNVVPVFQVGVHQGAVFIAMEFVDGMTLTSWLQKAPRRWQDIVRVLVRAGSGLEAAHKADLVHRDFKPDNILICHNNEVRVTDFGLARQTSALPAPQPAPGSLPAPISSMGRLKSHSITGQILGTPVYMAPEQHRAEEVDGRADQFSFCVTLYEALFGHRPFSGSTYMELSVNVATGKMAPIPATPRIPRYVRNVLLRGLSTDAKDRYPSMTVLLAELDRGPSQRRNIALAAIGVAGIGIGVTSLVLMHNDRAAVDPCLQPRAQVMHIWAPARRAQLESAF